MAARRGEWRRDAAKERHWRRMLREWRRSGLNVRDFCDWQNLSEPSFYAWRREIAQRDREAAGAPRERTARVNRRSVNRPATADSPAFLPLQVVAGEPIPQVRGEPFLELRLPTGVQLRIPGGFDRETLADVLAALQSREGARSC
jgi:hypothetical protein